MSQSKNSNKSNYQRGTSRGSSKNSGYGGPRSGQTGRSSGSGYSGKNHKRKPPFDYKKILIGILAVVILITCIVLVSKGFSKKPAEEETTTEQETELQKEVTVNGITISGLARDKAKEELLKKINWSLKVTFKEDTYELPNMMEKNVDSVLEEVFTTKEPKESYTVTTDGLEESIQAEVASMAKKWDVSAENAAITGFDPATDKFTFSDESSGEIINQEKLKSDIISAVSLEQYQSSIVAKSQTVVPEITREQARDQYQVIGTYTTTTTSNKDRNTNVKLSAEAFHGMIIKPGEEFSFNTTTGNRTLARGYKPAGAYVNGELVEEPGGGVCQVSSTLYNAVVFAGLKTTERHAHSYVPSYVTPGEDAMVSYDGYAGPDMKFVNNTKDSIGMKASFSNQKLSISIYGIPILEDGIKIRMSSKKVSELDPPAPTYVEDNTLQPDVEVVAKAATPGSRWVTNLITSKNGEVITDEFLHNSSYRGKPATIKRNTSGTVVVPETTTAPGQTNMPLAPTAGTAESNETPTSSTHAPAGPGEIAPPSTTGASAPTSASTLAPTPSEAPAFQAPGPGGSEGTIIAPSPLS